MTDDATRASLRTLILDAEQTVELATREALRRYLAKLRAALSNYPALIADAGDPESIPPAGAAAPLTAAELAAAVEQVMQSTLPQAALDAAAAAWPGIVDQTILPAVDQVLKPVLEAATATADPTVVDTVNSWRTDYLEQRTQQLAGVPDDVTQDLRDAIARQIETEGPDAARAARTAREMLADDDPAWQSRAETIGRTETGSALNNGARSAWEAVADSLGDTATVYQTWLATDDGKTREAHRHVDGTRVKLGDRFTVGGVEMTGPHDPNAPAELVINCRCTATWEVVDNEATDAGSDHHDMPGLPPVSLVAATEDTVTAPAPTVEQAAAPTAPAGAMPWQGYLIRCNTVSADGRLARSAGAVVRALPLTLSYQAEGDHGGAVAGTTVRVGRILTAEVRDDGVYATGDWLDPDADWTNGEAIRSAVSVVDKGIGTVSADTAPVVVSYGVTQPDGSVVPVDPSLVDIDGNLVMVMDQWELMGATLVAGPAFDVRIELVNEPLQDVPAVDPAMVAAVTAETTGAAVVADGAVTFPDGTTAQVGDVVQAGDDTGAIVAVDVDAQTVTVQVDGEEETATVPVADVTPIAVDGADDGDTSLVASADAYPRQPYRREWFEPVALDGPTRLTVTEDGRVFGHAAAKGVCHTGFPGQCVTVPTSPSGYAYFHTRDAAMDDGTDLPVGVLTVGGGHADVRQKWRPALAHYDESGSAVALVRAHEDEHGVQVTGQVIHGMQAAQVEELRRSPLSGDWREIGGHREMIAALAVNTPGFPIPQAAFGKAGKPAALVAAGVVHDDPADEVPETVADGITLPSGARLSRDDLGLVASLFARAQADEARVAAPKPDVAAAARARLQLMGA